MSFTKFIAGFDVHGDMQNTEACEAFFKFQEEHWKAPIKICGGDIFDFRPLRRKASEEERRESMIEDFNEGMKWLKRFKPTYFLRGNHDERLWDLAQENRGVITDYAYQGCGQITSYLDHINCRMFPWEKRKGVLRLGHLKVIHGFITGVTAARRTALAYGCSILMGHGHSIQYASIEGLDEPRVGMMCGCLCNLDMDYNRHQVGTLNQAHGWAYGFLNERTGKYYVNQARKIDGKWLLPSSFVTL